MTTDAHPSTHNRPNTGTIIGAILLLSPAVICCFLTLFVPTIRTFLLSMQNADLFSEATFVGLENYSRLFQDPIFWSALGFSFTHVVVRVIVVSIVPLLLALALSRFGPAIRISTRLLFTIPLAAFAPVFALLTWQIWFFNPATQNTEPGRFLVDPNLAGPTLFMVDSLAIFGVACGLGLIVYTMALRGAGHEASSAQRTRGPLLIMWGVSVIAVIALTLQEFTLSFALTRGGPTNATTSLPLLLYSFGFERLAFGEGAVIASLLLTLLAVLGIVVSVIIATTGAQIRVVTGNRTNTSASQSMAGVALGLLLFLSVGCWLLSFFPSVANLLSPSLEPAPVEQFIPDTPLILVISNTIIPALISVVIQLSVAYVGALGIGALRPLGKRSEWLLVLFSPWLFVTAIPLSLIAYQDRQNIGLMDNMFGMVTPLLISIPALFMLTLFFKGQQEASLHGQHSTFFNAIIRPSIPITILLGSIGLLLGIQSLYWPLLVSTNPFESTIPVFLLTRAGGAPIVPADTATLLITLGLPVSIFFLIVFSVFQIFYIDRLTFVTNRRAS